MHVIELHAENFKRLVAVDVTPTGTVVPVVGKNGAGKTSLLEAMLVALGGADYIPSKPIRKGEKNGGVRIKLGAGKPDLIVTRTFAAKEDGGYTTHLTVEGSDGKRFLKPQTMLDELFGALAFDPLAFTRMKAREQLEQLRVFVPDLDFELLDGQNRRDFDNRTDVNREIRALNARLGAMPVPGDPRQQRVDEAALVAELEQAGTVATEIERERARRVDLMRAVRATASEAEQQRRLGLDSLDRIAELEAEIARLGEHAGECAQRAADAAARAAELQAALEALPPLAIAPDTTSIRGRIDAARKTNLDVDARERVIKEREKLAESLKQFEQQGKALTDAIDARDAAKAAAVAAAKLPIDGLGFGDDAVLFNGLPFSQASSAEQLRVSVAIAAALSPKLKVAHVRDGSLLDDDGMELLRQLAEQYGFQVWVERVANDSPVGIVIEDGRVKASA